MTEFDSSDKGRLHSYIQRDKGRLIQYLRFRVPKITAKSFEEVALQAQLAQGWSSCIDEIEALAEKTPQSAPFEEFVDVTAGIPK